MNTANTFWSLSPPTQMPAIRVIGRATVYPAGMLLWLRDQAEAAAILERQTPDHPLLVRDWGENAA